MVQLLLFSVEDIPGAIPLADTTHVIRMVRLAETPGALPGEALMMNFHGRPVPVIPVRELFGLARHAPRLTDMLVIAHDGTREIALWVDATTGVQDLPVPAESPGQPEQQYSGVTVSPEGLRVITDLPRLIASRAGVPFSGAPAVPGEAADTAIPVYGEAPGMDGPGEFSPVASVLEERARKTAQPDEGLSETAMVEVLRFRLAYREYAIEMQHIREVILTGEITPVPGTPDYISGICVVRGEIISLVDLRVLLSIPERGLTDLNRVIVLTDQALTFGILADHITGIGSIGLDRIVEPDPDTLPEKSSYVKGIADGTLIVIDTSVLFSDPRMIIEDA
jgi:purine-binding chemotaxis protein CheW